MLPDESMLGFVAVADAVVLLDVPESRRSLSRLLADSSMQEAKQLPPLWPEAVGAPSAPSDDDFVVSVDPLVSALARCSAAAALAFPWASAVASTVRPLADKVGESTVSCLSIAN